MFKIVHLVDDTTAGGVTRYLDFLRSDLALATTAYHEVVVVPRNRPTGVPRDANMIVSHLAISWAGLPGLIALRARHSGLPMVHVEHSYSEAFTAINVAARGRFHCLLRTAYALFDQVIAVSATQAAWMQRNDLVRDTALRVIAPMVDLSGLNRISAPTGPVRHIAAIGRFESQKGFDVLIRAFRDIDDRRLTLTLHGDGSQRAMLERIAADDPRIRFAGFAASPALAYAACDIVAMPSRWEPYGLVAAEANVAGRQVLMSAVDGLRDQAGRGNVLVTDLSVQGWADAIRDITYADAALTPRTNATALRNETVAGWTALTADFAPQPVPALIRTV